jgi:hypothetical protein
MAAEKELQNNHNADAQAYALAGLSTLRRRLVDYNTTPYCGTKQLVSLNAGQIANTMITSDCKQFQQATARAWSGHGKDCYVRRGGGTAALRTKVTVTVTDYLFQQQRVLFSFMF